VSISEEYKMLLKADFESAVRNGLFVSGPGTFRSSQLFSVWLRDDCKMSNDLGDEEMLYGVMLSIRGFRPELSEPDFLSARRLTVSYAAGLRERWRQAHLDEVQRSSDERERALLDLKDRWLMTFKKGEKQDMLTGVYEVQLANARKVIGSGGNFQPELLMWRGHSLTGTIFQGPDPMTQAIALIQQSRPQGYSFAAEGWRGRISEMKEDHKWGDLAKSPDKVESFVQVCGENGGPSLNRTFAIDRSKSVLVPDPPGGRSRMPKFWGAVGGSPQTDPTANGAYS
jgi:hypothetical protein